MKKFLKTLIITCFICMAANIFSISAFASSSIPPKNVRIRNMWNSNYMINDNGIGKYSPSNVGGDCVWTIWQTGLVYFSIQNWDGTYLRANENGTVTCDSKSNFDSTYNWYLTSTNDGKQLITSCAYPGKAINIENLTGSLQLTTYYDTWESAKWIFEDITGPEFPITHTDNVIFQTPDQKNYLFGGLVIGPTSTMQAFINGNMLYQIIDKGDYCYIKYNPATSSSSRYFKATSASTYNTDSTVDDNDVDYRWKIEKNTDGTTSVVSVAHPEMCIANTQSCTLIKHSTAGNAGKWNMHPANALKIRLTNNVHTYTLGLNDSNREKAIFKYSGNTTLTSLDTQWQVIYDNNRMYLKNVLTGKYLRASGVDGDTQAYVTNYNYSYDSLYVWDAVNLRYPLGLRQNGGAYLHPAYQTDAFTDTENLNAVISYEGGYTAPYLDFEVVGFAY